MYYLKHKKYLKQRAKIYKKLHRKQYNKYNAKYRKKHKNQIKKYGFKYRLLHKIIKYKTCQICFSKFIPLGNRQICCSEDCFKQMEKEYNKKYKKLNHKKLKKYHLYYYNHQRKINNYFKLCINLRNRLNRALKLNSKKGHTLELLGCSIKFLKQYLEKQFTKGMNWNNYGRGKNKWNIDHIKPCNSFDLSKPEEQKKCFHYTNLQPLWAEENIKKGNKIDIKIS